MMKTAAVISNVVLSGFTCLVLVTDGAPRAAIYIVFSLLLVLIPILSAVVISRSRAGTMMKIVAAVCNVALFGLACWAIVDQYPHPEEGGLIAFTLLVVLTPILTVVAILRAFLGDNSPTAQPAR